MEIVYDIIYSFHMPLFFLVSGYCIGMKDNFADTPFSQQAKKTFTRLIVPYLVWSLFYIFLADKITSPERYTAIFTFRGIAPLWFLATLAMCELLFFGIAKLIRNQSNNKQILIISLIAVVCVLVGFIMRNIKVNNSLSSDNFTRIGYYLFITFGRLFISLPSYILGFIIAKTNLLKYLRKSWSLLGGITLITGVVLLVVFNGLRVNCHLFYMNNYWLFTLTSICGAVGVLMLSYSIDKFSGVLSYLGQNSLGLMILHYIPFKTVHYASNAIILIWNNEIFVSITATVVTILITLALIYLVKKKFFIYK